MQQSRASSTIWLLGRSLVPSSTSALFCIISALAIVAVGVLLASLHANPPVPGFNHGQLAAFYSSSIVHPLQTFFQSKSWSNIVIVSLWILVGVSVYSIFEAALHAYNNWREASKYVQFVDEQTTIHHPLEKPYFVHVLWKLGVSIVSVLLVFVARPIAQHTFRRMHQLITANSLGMAVRQFALATVTWIVLLHICIVLLRLYTLRTRLFGDDAAY